MGKIVKAAKIGYGAFTLGRRAVGMIQSPAKAARSAAVRVGRKAALAGLGKALGPEWAGRLISKLDIEGKALRAQATVKIPARAARFAMDPEGALLFERVTNDLLSAPFALLGYKLAAVSAEFDESSRQLTLGFALGALRIDRDARDPAAASPPVDARALQLDPPAAGGEGVSSPSATQVSRIA